jgi:hypothetical protein
MFEKRVPKRVFGPKGDEITETWRKRHNELSDLNSSQDNIIELTSWSRTLVENRPIV